MMNGSPTFVYLLLGKLTVGFKGCHNKKVTTEITSVLHSYFSCLCYLLQDVARLHHGGSPTTPWTGAFKVAAQVVLLGGRRSESLHQRSPDLL